MAYLTVLSSIECLSMYCMQVYNSHRSKTNSWNCWIIHYKSIFTRHSISPEFLKKNIRFCFVHLALISSSSSSSFVKFYISCHLLPPSAGLSLAPSIPILPWHVKQPRQFLNVHSGICDKWKLVAFPKVRVGHSHSTPHIMWLLESQTQITWLVWALHTVLKHGTLLNSTQSCFPYVMM